MANVMIVIIAANMPLIFLFCMSFILIFNPLNDGCTLEDAVKSKACGESNNAPVEDGLKVDVDTESVTRFSESVMFAISGVFLSTNDFIASSLSSVSS
jgi:hypothetical protein